MTTELPMVPPSPPSGGLRLRYSAVSDLGRYRKDNQDSGYASEHLLVVADGVGGAAYGDVASSTAVHLLRRLDGPPPEDVESALAGAFHRVHDRLAELVEEDDELTGTSTTLTAAVFDGTSLTFGHVGDSRAYLLRGGEIRQLTHDHTLVQTLVDEGRITEAEARVHPHRNIILKAVDGVHEAEPDLFRLELEVGDRVMVCSDGCTGAVTDPEIGALMDSDSVDAIALALVNAALEGGTTDNVTVVIAHVVDADTPDDPELQASVTTGPMLVGAAAHQPRRGSKLGRALFRNRAGATGDTVHGGSGREVDPELLRYAPRAPRRFAGLRRTAWLLVVLALLVGAIAAAFAWSRTQFFIAADGDNVAIYRGLDIDLGAIGLSDVYYVSDLKVTDLQEFEQAKVLDGIPATSEADARDLLTTLERSVCQTALDDQPAPSPTPTISPSPHAGKATPSPSAGSSPTPPATSSATYPDVCVGVQP